MKPCSQNRKPIAWLVLDALETREAAALRDHLDQCDGCRAYRDELLRLTDGLASAASDAEIEVSESFNRRLAERLQAAERGSALDDQLARFGGALRNWRVFVPIMAAAAIAVFVLLTPRHQPIRSGPMPPKVETVSAWGSESECAPTIANYQRVANRSLDELSELLSRQGRKSLPPSPVVTVSNAETAVASF